LLCNQPFWNKLLLDQILPFVAPHLPIPSSYVAHKSELRGPSFPKLKLVARPSPPQTNKCVGQIALHRSHLPSPNETRHICFPSTEKITCYSCPYLSVYPSSTPFSSLFHFGAYREWLAIATPIKQVCCPNRSISLTPSPPNINICNLTIELIIH
jgi:hypothetical protein